MAKRSWPHPVLDPEGEDYPDCAFQAAIQVKQTRTEFTLTVQIDVGSETLLSAIREETAIYVLQVHCPKTSYRDAFKFSHSNIEVKIPDEVLRGIFTVRSFIVASRSFSLSSNEFNQIFKDMAFTIEPGYVLAVAPAVEFEAEKSLDDLRAVKAICHIIRNPDPNATKVDFDFNQERIAIVLPQDQFKIYGIFKDRQPYSQIFVASLVLPAVYQGLLIILEENEDGVGSTRWRRVLKRKIKDIGKEKYAVDESFDIAQDILDIPFVRTFHAIDKTAEEQE